MKAEGEEHMHDLADTCLVDKLADRAETIVTGSDTDAVTWRIWGQGRPVILLHGDFGSWMHFVRNIEALEGRFRVHVPDMPGYGDSATPQPPCEPPEIARPLALGIREILGRTVTFDIVGFSYGGIVAGHLAVMLPEQVTRLILSGPGGFGIRSASKDHIALRSLRKGMTATEIDQVHQHNLGQLMIADPSKVDVLAVRIHRENISRARVRCGTIPDTDSLLQALRHVKARLAGIWGERDAFGDREHREKQKQLLLGFDPATDFRVVPGAGHWLFFECPETANRWLVEMLGS